MKRIQVTFDFNHVMDYKVEDGKLHVDLEVNTAELDISAVFRSIEELPIAVKERRLLLDGLESGLEEMELRQLFQMGIITKQRVG
jgi:hypothetical protein